MENKNYHTVETIPKSKTKILERGKIMDHNIHLWCTCDNYLALNIKVELHCIHEHCLIVIFLKHIIPILIIW